MKANARRRVKPAFSRMVEVADLVRDLVRHHGQGREHPEVHVHQERPRDDDAVGEVVERVADQDRHAAASSFMAIVPVRMVMQVALVVVRVMDQRELLGQEEAHDSSEDDPPKHVRIRFAVERLGQQVRDRRRKQQPGRHRHQFVDDPREVIEAEPRRERDRQQRRQQVGEDDVAEDGHECGQEERRSQLAARSVAGHDGAVGCIACGRLAVHVRSSASAGPRIASHPSR